MHILLLNWRDLKNEWAGGAEIYVTELAKRWVKSGHQVTFFCGQNYLENLPSEETVNGIRFVRKGGRYTLYLWAVWYYLTKFRKECNIVVDAVNGIPFFSVLYVRKPVIPLFFHFHGIQFFTELPFPISVIGYFIERYLMPIFYRNKLTIAISNTTKSDLVKIGFDRRKIQVVYPGADHGLLRINANKLKKFTKPTILYLGKIKKYKRVGLLVKLMPEILKEVPLSRLLIAGWGAEGPYLADFSMRSLVKNRIKILGEVSEREKRRLMAGAWVCVNPSIHEGWGLPVIEANLFKTPTVAFKVPGLSESIKDGETGILANDEVEFINGVVKILKDARLRNRLGEAARQWALTFNWDDSAEKFLKILKNQLAK